MPATLTTATCLGDDLRSRALQTPDETCWIFGDRTWSWASAWADVQRMAGALIGAGVRRGDRIGFLDRNNPATLMATHAAALLGAANVVINSYLTSDELAHVLADADVRVLFVGHDFVSTVAGVGAAAPPRVVVVGGPHDELRPMIDAAPPIDSPADVGPDDPCLVLYSSGTTGRPKGIVLTQHNLLTHTRNAFGAVDCEPGDRVLLSNVMFHSTALFAAAAGIPGIVAPDLMPDALVAALDDGLTHAVLTPAAIGRLEAGGLLEAFAGLRLVVYGSAPMPPARLAAAMTAWPATRFVHVYGMSECVAVLTALDDAGHRDPEHPDRQASCGRPIPGVQMRVVDPGTAQDVPAGRIGELWFRSEQTMVGYLGNPEATADMVVQDGWVRTGDLGRVDADGYVHVEDRIRDLILVNGWNVFSAEVERVLNEHPAVLESAVIGIPDEVWGEAVKAVVVRRPGTAVSSDDLIAYARVRLAAHKVPTSLDFATSLPRNAMGKLLKRTLRDPHWVSSGRSI